MALYALIVDSRVWELIETDGNISEMFAPELIWVDVTSVAGIAEGWSATQTDAAWSFAPYVPPPPTEVEIIAANTSTLQQKNQLAAAQKTALTNRIGTLLDAIELEMATPSEVSELPIRQSQLIEWKRYAVFLGRVTTQPGWALSVEWPVQPAEGMDLTVSAARPAQASI